MKFRIQVTLARLLLASTSLQVLLSSLPNQNQQHYVQCSSYLGDYFLPTAKLALNKIQQSLAPAHTNGLPNGESSGQLGVDNNTTKPASTNQVASNADASQQQPSAKNSNDDNRAEEPRRLNQEEPNKNEFVKLDTGSGPALIDNVRPNEQGAVGATLAASSSSLSPQMSVVVEQEQQAGSSMTAASTELSDAIAVISSTAASDSDPTSTVASADPAGDSSVDGADQGASSALGDDRVDGQQAPSSSSPTDADSERPSAVSTQETATTITKTPTAITTSIGGDHADAAPETTTRKQPASSAVESKSAEEAVKETELEAVAAVDASIGFGDPFASMSEPCFDEYGNARYCEPEFENAAFEKQVEVSSECGQPPSRFCTAYQNEHNDQIRNCHICDAQHPKKRHPASYLTDMNNSNNPTCWVSAPIQSPSGSSGSGQSTNSSSGGQSIVSAAGPATAANSATPTPDPAEPLKSDNVTLILNLDKKYEITYISMQFCSMKPDSLAIYKSMDYGRSWAPYQFYSSQCRQMYGRQSRSAASGQQRNNNGAEIEPSCLNSSQPAGSGSASSANSGRIAFSTLDGRQSSVSSLDRSQTLQDWITATDIKIVLDRHQAKWIHSNLVHAHHHQQPAPEVASSTNKQQASHNDNLLAASSSSRGNSSADLQTSQRQAGNNGEQLENSLTNPSDTFNYAMSDLTVGGRCKCNGHASRCIHGKDGRLQCDCHHNTAGRDCEKCAPFHFDRPWARATQLDANPCQPCNCNGHSRKCRFDAELYRLSGKRSGGVCIGCRDNTAGRHCHYCKEGFTRDHSKPTNDKEACKHCDCHPIGSLGRVCNQTTGQCPCKEGVAGLQCSRCAAGYQQSSSLTEPCIKLPENDINYEPSLTVDGDEQSSAGADNSQQPTLHQLNPPEQPAASTTNEAAGGEPGATSDSTNNGDRESLLPHLSRAPPSGQTRFKNKQQPPTQSIDDDEQGLQEQDKDDHSEAGLGLSSSLGSGDADFGLSRKYNRPQAAVYWPHQQGRKAAYYPGGRQYQRPRHQQFDLAEPAPVALDEDEDEDLLTQPMRGLRPTASQEQDQDYPSSLALDSRYYYNNNGGGGGPYVGGNKAGRFAADSRYNRPRAHSRSRGGQPSNELVPMANLDHATSGDADSMLEDGTGGSPVDSSGYQAAQMGSIYNEDNFNQIQAVPGSRIRGQAQLSRARHHQHQVLHHGGSRHRFSDSQNQADATSLQPALGANEIACAECQSGTRRLGFRQFCHLDYAIKATILYKFMAEDWTKFGVEIQDIFKSPAAVVSARSSYISDNTLQADEPQNSEANSSRTSVNNNPATIPAVGGSLQVDQLDAPTTGGSHRIKIGTVQTIWVPTEDVTCKCPGLKPSTTYLLMGSIDAKENSANSLQLDRHGIALEWKSSLQEKLIKYQRRHARGRC